MNLNYNMQELYKVIANIHELTGVWSNVHDLSGHDIKIRSASTLFCEMMNRTVEGHARCVACDEQAAKTCRKMQSPYHYRCHAGICETLIPIIVNGEVISFLGFGQMLDESDPEEQWRNTEKTLAWYTGDKELLKTYFFQIPQYSESRTQALTDILKTIADYILVSGTIETIGQTDIQRLGEYIEHHYLERLTLEQISRELSIGKTKICSLAKKLSKGKNLSYLIGEYRVRDARRLLTTTNLSIAEVAMAVGYEDYNYFTKIFKKYTGSTPMKYRKMN